MTWLLMLHILSLLCWSSGLLYLPALIYRSTSENLYSRKLFTLFLTPAAMLAIISGSLIFIVNQTTAKWLILKLTLVSLLVACHILYGLLILQLKKITHQSLQLFLILLFILSSSLMFAIFWIVLKKPS